MKLFADNRRAYFKKFIEQAPEEEEVTKSAIIGNLVDCLLLHPQNFDSHFYISTCASPPTGLMLDFVNALYKYTILATSPEANDWNITKPFEDIARDAYKESGFKITLEAVLNKFKDKDPELYYKELRDTKPKNLTVISLTDISIAERIVEELKSNPFTYEIINQQDTDDITVHNQLQIEDFTVFGLTMKAMLDKVIIDHKEKTIQIIDLKCVWSVENFFEEYYLHRRAYIQALIYVYAMSHYINECDICEGYKILNPMFLVCDSTNFCKPVIYKLSNEDFTNASEGFSYKNKFYKGVRHIIEELLWAKENNEWRMCKEVSDKRGIVELKKLY